MDPKSAWQATVPGYTIIKGKKTKHGNKFLIVQRLFSVKATPSYVTHYAMFVGICGQGTTIAHDISVLCNFYYKNVYKLTL